MPQLFEAKSVDEDWSGLKDPKARRKLQNRLNVRAHRRRKALLAQGVDSSDGPISKQVGSLGVDVLPTSQTAVGDGRRIALALESWLPILVSRVRAAMSFPLSSDHLMPMVRYNFVRASVTIMKMLSQFHFTDESWSTLPLFPAPEALPPALQPTELQRSIPHDAWIDRLPCPRLRDNVLLLQGTFDAEELLMDFRGPDAGSVDEFQGVIVWNEPWKQEGWEVTEGFVKKWGFLMKGCAEFMASTNRWREARGEEPLVFEIN